MSYAEIKEHHRRFQRQNQHYYSYLSHILSRTVGAIFEFVTDEEAIKGRRQKGQFMEEHQTKKSEKQILNE